MSDPQNDIAPRVDLSQVYPWHDPLQGQLDQRIKIGRLPHALLLVGRPGLGKAHFARRFAMQLLCMKKTQSPCGRCDSCRMFLNRTHADYIEIGPEGDSKVIKIDQVREVTRALSLKSQYGGHKVALFTPAEAMNHNSANSLLKTLEEPTPGTVLILVSAEPYRLPATIRSRCQTIEMVPPESSSGLDWLAAQGESQQLSVALTMAGGAPLLAQSLIREGALERRAECFSEWQLLMAGKNDPVELAARWSKEGSDEAIRWLYGWVEDAIRLAQAPSTEQVDSLDLLEELRILAQGMNLRLLYRRLDQLREALRFRLANLNAQMVLEEILVAWGSLKAQTRS